MNSEKIEKRKALFIEKSKKVHGDKYDYSKVEYVDSTTDVCIVCPDHGEFWQKPVAHVRGHRCPECGKLVKKKALSSNLETFIKRANEKHNNKYDYSKVVYENAMTKVCIICPEHGEFWMTPMNHLLGQDCPKCKGKYRTTEDIIKLFKEKYGDKYDYSKVDFKKMHEKVCIICPDHGEFWQTPDKHLYGRGCPKCADKSRAKKLMIGKYEFIRRAKELFGDKYNYDEVEYKNGLEKVKIICSKHGPFWQKPFYHLNGHGCKKCGLIESRGETELFEYIVSLVGEENVEQSNRKILDGHEIDIYLPKHSIGIEYNGLKWHSEQYKDKNYHLLKTKNANEKGVKLIQVFEDEYLSNKELVKAKIRRIIHEDASLPYIMARKCTVCAIEKNEAKDFINANHIQGYSGCKVALGCFYDGKLVGVMTFQQASEGEWVLNRFATDISLRCQGVGGKLFNYFVKQYNPSKVKSFADLRWTVDIENNLYTKLGFKVDKILEPEYRYVHCSQSTERIHKFNFRKNLLSRRYGMDKSLTESEMAKELGYYRVYDCGLVRYLWIKDVLS